MAAGNWSFDNGIASEFDDHVRAHVPLYSELHSLVKSLSTWFIESNTNVYDIGTSLGETLFNISETHKEGVQFIGIDSSSDMVARAKDRFAGAPNIEVIVGDLLDAELTLENASLVTSILTIMFTPYHKRAEIISKIHAGLIEKGAFIMVEKVRADSPLLSEITSEIYQDNKAANGVESFDILEKARSIRGQLKPLTIAENVELLKGVGFSEVSTFLQWCGFVGFIAIK